MTYFDYCLICEILHSIQHWSCNINRTTFSYYTFSWFWRFHGISKEWIQTRIWTCFRGVDCIGGRRGDMLSDLLLSWLLAADELVAAAALFLNSRCPMYSWNSSCICTEKYNSQWYISTLVSRYIQSDSVQQVNSYNMALFQLEITKLLRCKSVDGFHSMSAERNTRHIFDT
jgi:hypothetical protein